MPHSCTAHFRQILAHCFIVDCRMPTENDIKVQTGQRRSCCIIIEQKSNKLSIQSRLSCHRRLASSIWKHRGTWAKTEKPKNNEQHSDITNICFVSLILRTVHLAQWLIACSSIVVINYFMLIHLVYIAIVFGQWLFVSFHPSPLGTSIKSMSSVARASSTSTKQLTLFLHSDIDILCHIAHIMHVQGYMHGRKNAQILFFVSRQTSRHPAQRYRRRRKWKKKWTEIDSYLVDGPI